MLFKIIFIIVSTIINAAVFDPNIYNSETKINNNNNNISSNYTFDNSLIRKFIIIDSSSGLGNRLSAISSRFIYFILLICENK